MVNYQEGKIYKIINDSMPNMVYYGSTCNTFAKRMGQHKALRDCSSRVLFEYGNPQMILIEKYPCNDKMELNARERYYIENNECVNKVVPGRTDKEYREDNKEKIILKAKEYYEANKEQISLKNKEYRDSHKEEAKVYQKEYYEDNKEKLSIKKKEYHEANKVKISIKKKEHYEANKEKILLQKKQKITCECGSSFSISVKARHYRSKKHQNFISSSSN